MRVFLDTNVVLDLLLGREPFADDAARIWTLSEEGKVVGLVSAVSFTTIYYMTRQRQPHQRAIAALKVLRDVFNPVACDATILNRAIDSDFKDFEDAVQHFSALAAGAEVIVTRNPSDFAAAEILVMAPAEFLARHWPAQ